jgi:hypothetical protein
LFFKAIARLILCTTTLLSYTAIANEPYVIKAALSQEFKKGLYPSHLKMQDSAGIRNVFRQGID